MNKINISKRNIIILTVIIFVTFTLSIFLWKKDKDKVLIPEIKYLVTYYNSFGNSMNEYYLVKNCPTDLNQIKELVDSFNDENEINKVRNGISEIYRNFLRESSYTNDSSDNTSEQKFSFIQDHFPQDGVAFVVYDTVNYNIVRAWYTKKNRDGKIIDEIKIGYDY